MGEEGLKVGAGGVWDANKQHKPFSLPLQAIDEYRQGQGVIPSHDHLVNVARWRRIRSIREEGLLVGPFRVKTPDGDTFRA